MDDEDLDLEFLYSSLAKAGKKPSPDDEDRFIALIDDLVCSPTASRFSARREALRKLYG